MSTFDPRDRTRTPQRPGRVRLPPTAAVSDWSPAGEKLRLMARSGGYVMVRWPRATPFVLSEKEWASLDLYSLTTPAAGEQGGAG